MKDNKVIKKKKKYSIGVHGHTMVKVSFNVVLSANKACKPDNWPACLAIPLHATLQNQKSKSLKAKSQKQTATCQSHSSEFGLCEPETA